jgi:hypothetical protein
MGCFAFRAENSGACSESAGAALTGGGARVNKGDYPAGFYEFLGSLAGQRPFVAVVSMRLAVLLSVLLCWALALWAAPTLRRTQVLAWSVASIPLGISIFASTNPSAWATAGLAALLPAVIAMYQATDRRGRVLAVAATVVAALMVMNSRSDAAAMAVVLVVWLTLLFARGRSALLPAAVSFGVAIAGAVVFRSAGQSGMLTGGFTGQSAGTDIGLMWSNALALPGLWAGVFGSGWNLGWLDTGMSPTVWLPLILVVGGLLLVAAERAGLLKAVLVAPFLGMMIFLPLYTLQQSAAPVGQYFQPRYLLPLVFVIMGAVLAPVFSTGIRLSRPQRILGVTACSLAASVALHTQIRRYVTGLDVSHPNLNVSIEWWRLPISPMTTWIIGSLTGVLLFAIAFWLNGQGAPRSTVAELHEGGGEIGPTATAADDSALSEGAGSNQAPAPFG